MQFNVPNISLKLGTSLTKYRSFIYVHNQIQASDYSSIKGTTHTAT